MNKNYNEVNVIVNDEFCDDVFVCPICGGTFKGFGNNPYPIAEGRCCNECNGTVIMMRLMLSSMEKEIDKSVKSISRNSPISGFVCEKFVMGVFRNRLNKLEVVVLSNGYQYENEVRCTIQNYIDDNYNNKPLYNIPFRTTTMVKTCLAPLLAECNIYNS